MTNLLGSASNICMYGNEPFHNVYKNPLLCFVYIARNNYVLSSFILTPIIAIITELNYYLVYYIHNMFKHLASIKLFLTIIVS